MHERRSVSAHTMPNVKRRAVSPMSAGFSKTGRWSVVSDEFTEANVRFRELLRQGAAHQDIIALLMRLRATEELSADDVGWVLWNLCDQYAMVRDAERQYRYQREFRALVETHAPERLHWVVSDSTQALTLIACGYGDFWWDTSANALVPRVPETRNVRFESHRATAGAFTRSDLERATVALEACAALLAEDLAWVNRDFASATLRTLLVGFHHAWGDEESLRQVVAALEGELDEWRTRVPGPDTPPPDGGPRGSWAQLNATRPGRDIYVALHNAACTLARAGRFPSAERMFGIVAAAGHALTAYGRAMQIWACWENRRDRDEVRRLCERTDLTPQQLERWAPELVNARGGTDAST